MEIVEEVRAYIYIAYDTSNDTIVVTFQYFDRSENIPSWGSLSLGIMDKLSSWWVQHRLVPHEVLEWDPGLVRDIWVGFTIKYVWKDLLQGKVAQVDDTFAQIFNHSIGCQKLVFLSLVCINFWCNRYGGLGDLPKTYD